MSTKLDPEHPSTAVALEALHVAATALRWVDGVTRATADNDHQSGEIVFHTHGKTFLLRLQETEPDETPAA